MTTFFNYSNKLVELSRAVEIDFKGEGPWKEGGGVGIAADCRISKSAYRRTQIFIKKCRRLQISYLPEP